MLEHRPITQKVLTGTGAFAFVFGAAMAGSAFMISGGFGLGGQGARADGSAASAAEPVRVALRHVSAYANEPRYEIDDAGRVRAGPNEDALHEPAAYAVEDLAGGRRGAHDPFIPDEAALLRQIEREFLEPYGLRTDDPQQNAHAALQFDPYAAYGAGLDPKKGGGAS